MFNNYLTLSPSFIPVIKHEVLALDCDFKISNIVFLYNEAGEIPSIRHVTIDNNKLKDFLQDFCNNIFKVKKYKIYITGKCKNLVRKIVDAIFEYEIFIIDEVMAISNGFQLVSHILNVGDIQFLVEDNSLVENSLKMIEKDSMIAKFRNAMEFKLEDEEIFDENKFNSPSILILASSVIEIYLVKKDSTIESITTNTLGKTTLEGISKCLMNSNNFEDIVKSALKGNRENTDTQIFEVFSSDVKSPYGKLPPNIPIFPFGKCADHNKGIEKFNQNDLMESLCNLFLANLVIQIIQICKVYKLRRVYIFGTMFDNPCFARLLNIRLKLFSTNLNIKIIKCDYLSAIGLLKL